MIVNLTPHAIDIVDEANNVVATFQSQGVARATQTTEYVGEIDGVRITKSVFGEPVNLPEPQEGVHLIVSLATVNAARAFAREGGLTAGKHAATEARAHARALRFRDICSLLNGKTNKHLRRKGAKMMHIMIVNAYSNLLVWNIGVYEGENKIALNIEYFQIPTILYPLIRLDSWIKGSRCRRCDMEVLRGMGMVV